MAKKILIAEDDQFLIKMYKLQLEDSSADVEIAVNGKEAIASINKEQPDLLLLDLLMPEVDGFQVLEHIKEKKYKFPVVILSNLSQEVDKDKCLALGAKDYFVKSDMDLEELGEKIAKYLK